MDRTLLGYLFCIVGLVLSVCASEITATASDTVNNYNIEVHCDNNTEDHNLLVQLSEDHDALLQLTEGQDRLTERIEEVHDLLSNLVSKLENGEFSCTGSGEETEEEPEEEPEDSGPVRDCYEIQQNGETDSGVYQIQPNGSAQPFNVSCDMDTDGGGWTLIQRRQDGSVDFYREWAGYRNGFGSADGEYWLGNDNIHDLSTQKTYQLRIDLEDFENSTRYAVYATFHINGLGDRYRLIIGAYSGDAGDSLSYHNKKVFSARDADHDGHQGVNCASRYSAAWWYGKPCHKSNLNGLYLGGEHTSFADGIEWSAWRGFRYSFKTSEMKIRPVN